MKNANILGLAAMALVALMAMAGTASATTLTSSGATYTSTIELTSTNSVLTGPFGFGTVGCNHSKMKGTISNHGTGVTASGAISELTFTTCTAEVTSPVGVAAGSGARGSLEVHNISGTKNGTLTWLNAEINVHKTLLGTCNFITGSTGTDIGTLTGSATGNAVLDINASIPSKQCGTGKWEGTYTVTTPNNLTIDA